MRNEPEATTTIGWFSIGVVVVEAKVVVVIVVDVVVVDDDDDDGSDDDDVTPSMVGRTSRRMPTTTL